jgi:dimethylaniline monooxygenase (N-oxide forming)
VQKKIIIIGAGPCGLVAIKEMLEAGHEVIAFEKGPGLGGTFCRSHDTQYENLYLTISNMFMTYSDFPAKDSRIKYWSKSEYAQYLEAYTDHFGLRPHIVLNTSVEQARQAGDGWLVTTQTQGEDKPVVHAADMLVVATGANQTPNCAPVDGFEGKVMHSSEFVNTEQLAGKRVLLVGVGESGADIGADICRVASETFMWARSPISVAPRFPSLLAQDVDHDELELLRDPAKWEKARVSDFLEVITISRMANAAPMWAYSVIRHMIWGLCSKASPAAKLLSTWCRQGTKDDPWQTDQVSVPTKNARICTEAARGNLKVVIAPTASFSGGDALFKGATFLGDQPCLLDEPQDFELKDIDTVILCTGYRTECSWLKVDDMEWDPRLWFKHCFPPGLGHKLIFLGWARPHQGGIPACADILARYAAATSTGELSLPGDYAALARGEAENERTFYKFAQNVPTLVDYPAFMDAVAKLTGCMPRSPSITAPSKLIKYWIYPNWPVWYRQRGRGAKPEVLDNMLDSLPLKTSYRPDPFILLALVFSILQWPVNLLLPKKAGLGRGWLFKSKKHLLHGNQ